MFEEFVQWRKSSRSDGGENCLEVAVGRGTGRVAVRDTKDRSGPLLAFSLEQWMRFLDCARRSALHND
nr:DUF397 domain-containing protein [Micromonospora sp. DSM 115978]